MNNAIEKKTFYVLAAVVYYIVTSIAALLLGIIQPATHNKGWIQLGFLFMIMIAID